MAVEGPVLITGGGGGLASALAERLRGRTELEAPTKAELDVTDTPAVEAAFERLRPKLVLNAAAIVSMGECERDPDRTMAVNGTAVLRLARLSADAGAKLVHISSNFVFDGLAPEAYDEEAAPNPRSIYGISKVASEGAALAYAPGSLVARTAGLYGLKGSESKGGNFVVRILGLARERGALEVVDDQSLNPTYTEDLADALLAGVEREAAGLFHLTNAGSCSYRQFAQAIVEIAGLDVPVHPINAGPHDGVAYRPPNGTLVRPSADAAGLPELRSWREALADYMQRAGLSAVSAS